MEKQDEVKEVSPSLFTRRTLFVFSKKSDVPLILIATLTVCISCVAPAMSTVVYGKVFLRLTNFLNGDYDSRSQFLKEVQIDAGVIVALGFGKMLFNWLGVYFWMKFGEIQLIRARKQLYSNTFTTDHEWFENKTNLMGEVSQINRCVEEFRAGTAGALGSLISTVASIIAMLVTAFVQSWALTLIILASTPLMAVIAWYFGNKTFRAAAMENDSSAKASKILDWNLSSGSTVRLFNGKYIELVKFNKYADLSRKSYNALVNSVAANTGILSFLTLMTFVQAFWFGNHMIVTGKLEINQVFTCFSACMMLGSEVSLITSILAFLNKSYAAIGKICELIDETNSPVEEGSDYYPTNATGLIEFRNVYFAYASRADTILKDVRFSIKPKQFNYIIGKSGSGKSTISNLIIKFYKCETGSILIDGHDIKSLSHKWITDNITLIQQNPVLFNDTVRTNVAIAGLIRFDLNDVPELLVEDALDFSLLSEDVNALDDGINTVLTPNSLSGGQQQRLSIARAYIRDTPILILDETISALDNRNKDTIIKNLKKWRTGKTTIIITHDHQHIEPIDNVILLEDGQVNPNFVFSAESFQSDAFDKTDLIETVVDDVSEKGSYHYLFDPAILKDLEKQNTEVELQLMPISAIVRFFLSTNDLLLPLLLGLVASLVLGAISPIFSFFVSRMLAIMVDAALGLDVSNELIKTACTLIGIVAIDALASYLSQYILGYVSEAWIVKLRKLAFAKLAEQDISFLTSESKRVAELTALLLNDTRDLRTLAAELFSLLINIVVLLSVGIIWSIVAGWKLALVGISFVPLFLLVTALYSRLMSFYEFKYKECIAKVENHNHSTILGMKSIYSMNLTNYFMEIFAKLIENVEAIAGKRAFATGFGVSLSEAVTASAFGACIYYGMELVSNGEYNQSQLLQVITLLTFTMANAASLLGQLPSIARGQRSGTLIIKLLNLSPSVVEIEGDVKPNKSSLDPIIRFNCLDFSYEAKNKVVLKDLSFTISRGETIAIVGQSGAGKSTIASLLLRLYRVKQNTLFVENIDINKLDIDWIRDNISIVPQFACFFEGTIFENMVYGIPPNIQIAEEDVIEALEFASIYDFIKTLPDGMYTKIGEAMTASFSGGQMQRLSIARALIRKPKVLIMDECTSNLDPENTKLILELIQSLKGKFTIILITHDPNMIAIATRIIVLKNGKVAETGDFNALVESNGVLSGILHS